MPSLRSLVLGGLLSALVLIGWPVPSPLAPRSASASTLVQLSLGDIVRLATAVVAGTPLDSLSVWEDTDTARGQRIVTYTRVRVDQLFDGTAAREIWVRTLGGVIGDIGQRVDGEAILVRGQPGLFFLRQLAAGPLGVVGMSQGHLRLEGVAVTPTARVLRLPSFARMVERPGVAGGDTSVGLQALHGQTLEQATRLIRAARQGHAL